MPPRSLMLIELSLRDMQKASASVERAISRVAMAEVDAAPLGLGRSLGDFFRVNGSLFVVVLFVQLLLALFC